MTRALVRLLSLAAALAVAVLGFTGHPAQARSLPAKAPSDREQTLAFWTKDKVRAAVPRDFVRDEATGRFHLRPSAAAQPRKGKPGTGTGTGVLGAEWTGGGKVQSTTGKVLFAMGGSYYVCSASTVTDSVSGRSIILTAGHCVYDGTDGWATKWIFVPDYDAKPVALDGNGNFCAATQYGCWTASAMVASSTFTQQTSFNTTATLHDYAFVTVDRGGLTGSAELDQVVGTQAIAFAAGTQGAPTHLFGYPAAKPYDGTVLSYSLGALGLDPDNGNLTYRVASDMTGGCSGGPWFQNFSGGSGTIMSVNSYGYSRLKALHGPILGSEASGMYQRAATANGTVRY